MKRPRLRRVLTIVVAVLATALATVKILYGLGAPYPDTSTAPRVPSADLSVLVELDLPPGNVTVSPDGRIFFNTHPFTQSHRFADAFLFELSGGYFSARSPVASLITSSTDDATAAFSSQRARRPGSFSLMICHRLMRDTAMPRTLKASTTASAAS